jgi:hypothetical protein
MCRSIICTDLASISVLEQNGDFIDEGFAQAKLAVLNIPANAEIEWSVVSVRNNSSAMAEGFEQKITGLSWGDPIPENVEPPDTVAAKSVILTDIIGKRTIAVNARIIIKGKKLL